MSPKPLATHATLTHFIACERPTTCDESRALVQVAARRDVPSRSSRRANVTRGYVLARARAPRLASSHLTLPYLTSPSSSHLTSPCIVSSCLASSHLASRPRARKQRVFAACALLRATAFLPPFSRIRVYIFLRQLNRADS